MGFYTGKKVLVTGGTGLIGRPLVEMLLADGATVCIVSLDDPANAPAGAEFVQADLRELANCQKLCQGRDIVFHLAGVKGSPVMTQQRPASMMVPSLMFNTNMMEAAFRCGVERYLFTSTVGVYAPAEVFQEDSVWTSFPSEHDWFPGWGKRIGELQADAYRIEHGWDKIAIVRPANVYGPHDTFEGPNAMVVPSLIRRAVLGENPLVVWGDGSPIRDFIHARDVARGMMMAVEMGINQPINLGSGTGVSIRELAEIVASAMGDIPIVWDTSKPKGDARRLMDTKRAESYGIRPQISFDEGVRETLAWYQANRDQPKAARYNAFTETRA